MSYQISDLTYWQFTIDDSVVSLVIPKFRIDMIVDEPLITIYWSDSEKAATGIRRSITMDYNDVMFGAYVPTSAEDVRGKIYLLQQKAWNDIINGYVPYTGATNDVDLGTFGLTTDFVAFSQTPTVGPGNAQIGYNGQTQALAYDFNSSGVRCNIGQQMFAFVKNDEAFTINKGEAVYLFSASGNKATVKLASNTSDTTSDTALGLAAEDILAGQNGLIISQGVLDGINTLAYTPGDNLYLGVTPGTLTNVKPYAPNNLVYMGIVEKSNAGNGQIFVRLENGFRLQEIHDVDLITTPPSTGDVLTYNGTLWVNQAPASGSGTVTSIATTSPITGGTITTSGTIGINQATSIQDGYLSSADWSTFNGKQAALVSGTNIKTINSTSLLGSGNIAIVGLTDGDKGDITVSSSGTIWTIDARAVTFPKIQAMTSASRLLGRGDTLGSADIEEITLGTGIVMSGTTLDLQLKTINNTIVRGTGNISTPYTLSVQALSSSPVDAQTIYFGNLPKAPVTVAATSKVYIPRAGTIKRAEIYCYSGTAGTNQAWSGYVRLNNTTDTLIATLSVATSERIFSNSALSIAVVAGDYFEIKFINPTWATNPLTTIFGGYIYIE